jgi:hypothetical protein
MERVKVIVSAICHVPQPAASFNAAAQGLSGKFCLKRHIRHLEEIASMGPLTNVSGG